VFSGASSSVVELPAVSRSDTAALRSRLQLPSSGWPLVSPVERSASSPAPREQVGYAAAGETTPQRIAALQAELDQVREETRIIFPFPVLLRAAGLCIGDTVW